MPHHEYIKTVRAIAASSWGKKHDTQEEAVRDLSAKGYDVATAALLEIVRRINQVADVLHRDPGEQYLAADYDSKSPANAVVKPDVKIGQVFYHCGGVEEGISAEVVVSITEDGHVRTICVDPYTDEKGKVHLQWLTNTDFEDEAQALLHGAKRDLDYLLPRVELARKAIAAVEAGTDLSEFRDAFDDD